jgi:hypothetical protein
MFNAFDILKKLPDGGIVWIEAVKDLETARERIELMANYKPGDYVVFCQETQSVIAMPWISFSRHEPKRRTCPKTATKNKTKKVCLDSSAKPKANEVVAKIIADIGRTLRHE